MCSTKVWNDTAHRYLHAKALLLDFGDRLALMSGSANPSRPAWISGERTNFEAMLLRTSLGEADQGIVDELLSAFAAPTMTAEDLNAVAARLPDSSSNTSAQCLPVCIAPVDQMGRVIIPTRTPTGLISAQAFSSHPQGDRTVPVAKQLGIRVERLIAALDVVTDAEVATRNTAAGRRRRVFSEEAIAQVRDKVHDEISVKQASRMLGLTIARVRILISTGRLRQSGNRLSRSEVDQLMTAVQSMAAGSMPPEGAVGLEWALRHIVPRDETDRFFESVLAGHLTLHRGTGKFRLSHLLVDKEAVHAWRHPPRSWLTIPELAERLGLKQQVAYHLVRVGLIPADTVRINSRTTQIVAIGAANDFERSLETLSRRASREGIDPRQGLRFASESGIELISGPRIDGGRQYFVRRLPE